MSRAGAYARVSIRRILTALFGSEEAMAALEIDSGKDMTVEIERTDCVSSRECAPNASDGFMCVKNKHVG